MTDTLAKSAAEAALENLSTQSLRVAIARLARNTPGTIYGSGDIDPRGRDQVKLSGVVPALLLIAARGAQEIDPGKTMTLSFTGLSTNDMPYGDWQVVIKHIPIEHCDSNSVSRAEQVLGTMAAKDLLPTLSRLANLTERTLYYNSDFAGENTAKIIADGSSLDSAGQAGMFLCSELKDFLVAGETWASDFIALSHGAGEIRNWRIAVTRQSF